MSSMGSSYRTRDVFLKSLSAIYLIAFISLYSQIPGLFGRHGVLPAQTQLEGDASRPTLLWLRGQLGLDTGHAMELLALLGAGLALLAVLLETCRVTLVFAALLVLYASLVQVGQVFLFYQWDTLLMETGLLAVVLAPALPCRRPRPSDPLGLWLLRWLLFRLVFSTGAVKLLSECPAWWGLTALESHFQSQCMPTVLARFAHQLPAGLLRATTVFTLVAELAGPFLLFAPVRRLRMTAFYVQVFLQLMTMATGSFSFHGLLVLALCLSLLDDDWFTGRRPAGGARWPAAVCSGGVLAALLLAVVGLFQLRVNSAGLSANIGFTRAEFSEFVHFAVPASILLGVASFLLTAADAITTAVLDTAGGSCRRLNAVLSTVTTVLVSAAVLSCSLVPYTMLDTATHRTLPAPLRQGFADYVQPLHVFGSYGLFKQMTGVGGRPEVVLQGADALAGPWQDIEFRYKPGDVTVLPPLTLPHQPRLDWQMWIAALGDYHANPWLTSLAYRLLTAQPEVVRLLDTARYPFADKPPKYIRGLRFNYRYTPWPASAAGAQQSWWQREGKGEEYLPTFAADHKPLLDYLKEINVIGLPEEKADNAALIGLLDAVRALLDQWEARNLIWAMLLACWAVGFTRGRLGREIRLTSV